MPWLIREPVAGKRMQSWLSSPGVSTPLARTPLITPKLSWHRLGGLPSQLDCRLASLAMPSDLPAEAFCILRRAFLDPEGHPIEVRLRPKRNTQDDPFDEKVAEILDEGLPRDVTATKAGGPLITPDSVLSRPELVQRTRRAELRDDSTVVAGIEVKKLDRKEGAAVGRQTGMDFNSTAPCGTIRIYDGRGRELDIRGFYLFVALEEKEGVSRVSDLVLCDGNFLNDDFELYLSIVGPRTKEIGLGTYGDGANRNRPMMLFSNPLAVADFNKLPTLVHVKEGLEQEIEDLRPVGRIVRTTISGAERVFYVYRMVEDVPESVKLDLKDPLPSSSRRVEKTQPRGRFRLPYVPAD
jgi:hypothetical protein